MLPPTHGQATELAHAWEANSDNVDGVKAVIARLPEESYSILWALFYLFEAVLANSEKNRMDSNALGVSIGPTVFAGCVCTSLYLSVYLPICLSTCGSIYLFVHPIYLFVCYLSLFVSSLHAYLGCLFDSV